MASPVPYSGVPDVSPQVNPISPVHEDTPIAAFGGAVAGAVTHLGETVEGAGKELFARGYAMQELNEQMKADQAAADVTDKMTNRYLEYDKLKGQDRVDGFPQYQKDLSQIRQDGASQLDSPYAKIQYLRDSRRNESAMLWHGGMLARQGQDEFATQSANLKMDSASDRLATLGVGEGPEFDQGVADVKRSAGNLVTDKTGIHPGDPNYDEAVAKLTSPHVAKIVQSIGKDDPAKAKDLADKYTKTGLLRPEDSIHIAPQLDNAIETKDARRTAHGVATGDPKYWGNESYDTAPALEGLKASPGTTGSYNSVGPDLKDGSHPVGKYGPNSTLVASELPKLALTDERGVAVTTEDQFKNSPKAQDDFAKAVFPQLQKDNKTYNAAYKAWSGSDDPNRLNAALQSVAKNSDPALVSEKARAAQTERSPNSPVASDNASELAVQHQNTLRQIDILSDRRTRDSVIDMINGTGTMDGRVPTSLGEAMKDPKFADEYTKLPAEDQSSVLKILHQNSDLLGVRETSVGANLYNQWRSVAINRGTSSTPKELQDFSDLNLLQMPISPEHRKELMTLQHAVVQGQIANPNVTYAMKLPAVQKVLSDAGISKSGTPDEFSNFSNSYHDAIVNYGQGAERSVKSDNEFAEIAKQLIGTKPGTLWGTNPDLKYNNIYGSASGSRQRQGNDAFSKQYGRAYDPDNQTDLDNMNRIMNWMIFNDQGRAAKPTAPKSAARAQ